MPIAIEVLHGDQTGEELLTEALRVLDPAVTGLELRLRHWDLGLESRRATANRVVFEASAAMREGTPASHHSWVLLIRSPAMAKT